MCVYAQDQQCNALCYADIEASLPKRVPDWI